MDADEPKSRTNTAALEKIYMAKERRIVKMARKDQPPNEIDKNIGTNRNDTEILKRSSRALPALIPLIGIGLKVIGIGLQVAGIFQKMNSDRKMAKNFQKVFEGISRNYDAINRNYNAIKSVEEKIDRNFVALVLLSQMVNETLSVVEQTRIEMHQQFNRVLRSIENSRIEPTISKLNNFVEYFAGEKEIVTNLPLREYISKLQEPNNILLYLKDSRTPKGDNLRTPLYDIIEQGYAVPKDAGDKTAFAALHALHYGTQTYVSVMFFVLEQYSFLANYYYHDANLDEYNKYFVLIKTSFRDFKHSLVGGVTSEGLIGNVIGVIRTVQAREFIVNEREDVTELLEDRIKSLNEIKQQLLEMTLPMIFDTPEKITGKLYFKSLGINTPMGDWQDGRKVSYAVQYKSNDTYSEIGEWSTPFTVAGWANPFLRIPVDSQRRTRLIFRKFDNEKPQLVGVIEGKYQTEFRDVDRDLYNVASSSNEDIAINEVEVLIRSGANVTAVFDQGRSAIHAAAQGRNIKLAQKFLITNNATDVNAKDSNGYTPIFIAAEAAHDDFIELLIKNGADVNIRNYSGNMTALHIVAYKGYVSTVNTLMQSTAIDVNAKDSEGFTSLHNAVFGGVPVVTALISNNSTAVNPKSNQGLTPLHLASINNHRDIAEILLKHQKLDINSKAEGNLTALHFASAVGNLDMVKFLIHENQTDINAKSIDYWTPLHFAISLEKEDVALELLSDNRTEVNLKAEGNITTLHLAATTGQTTVLLRLLEKNVSVNERTKEGLTPLHLAAMNGNPESISILLKYKANIEEKTAGGFTPLHLSVSSQNSNLQTVKHLISKGADLNVIPNNGQTFLHLAAKSKNLDIVKFFVEKKYNVSATDKFGNIPLHFAAESGALDVVKYLVTKETNISVKNDNNQTFLHFAVSSGNLEVVKYFTEKGSDVNSQDKDRNSPLYLATQNDYLNIVDYLIEEKHADVRSKNKGGQTVLHLAASSGNIHLARYLLRKRADINAKDDEILSPLLFASRNGHLNIIKYFIEEKEVNVNVICNFCARPLAAYHGYLDVVKYLLNKEDDLFVPFNNMVSLFASAQNGHLDLVRFLLGENLNTKLNMNQEGAAMLLFYALQIFGMAQDEQATVAKYYFYSLQTLEVTILYLVLLAAENDHLAVVKYLIDEKLIDVNFRFEKELTLLHFATANGYLNIVEYLINVKSADLSVDDNSGMTSLLYAAKGDHLHVVKFLTEKGAALNSNRYKALLFAAANGNVEMAKYFIKRSADVNAKSKGGQVYDLTLSQFFGSISSSSSYEGTPLCIAARKNHLNMVKYLTEQGANVNDVCKDGQTPLHLAILNDLKMTVYLIEKGADINAKDDLNSTSLHNAAKYGLLDVVEYLVNEHKVNINAEDNAQHTSAYYAARNGHFDIVKFLVNDRHAIFDLPRDQLTDLLDNAVKIRHPDLVRYLIQKGARCSDYMLHNAAENGDLQIVKYLVENGANVNAKTTGLFSWGVIPLHEAASNGHLHIVKYFVDEKHVNVRVKDNYNWTPLHYAAKGGHLDVVKYLIGEKRVETNIKGTDSNSPLTCAADHPSTFKYIAENSDLHAACEGNIISCLKGAVNVDNPLLVTYYASNVNASYRAGVVGPEETLLQHAVEKQHYKVAEYLINAKADVNARSAGGLFLADNITALHIAAASGDLDMAKLLVNGGARVHAKATYGLTPLNMANLFCNTAVADFLKSKGTSRHHSNAEITKINNKLRFNNGHASEQYDQVSSSGCKPVSWINVFARTIIDTLLDASYFIYSPFKSPINMEYPQVQTIPITSTDTNGTLLLLDVFARKITGQKYCSITDSGCNLIESMGDALRVTDEFERVVRESITDSESSLCISNFDFVEIHTDIARKIRNGKFHEISRVLRLYVEKACNKLEAEELDAFVTEFDGKIDEALCPIIQNMLGSNNTVETNYVKERPISFESNKIKMCLNNTLVQGRLT